MNAWADTCPNRPGYDELGNYMTYNTAVCFAGLGHLTRGQVERAHLVTAELNPVLYAWGQYYAATAAPAPPASPPPPETGRDLCRVSCDDAAMMLFWAISYSCNLNEMPAPYAG